MNQLQVKGSLTETQKQRNLSFAEVFVTVDAILIVDVSGSMSTQDVHAEDGVKSRFSEANRQLKKLQARMPGRLAVVEFSDDAAFCPDGQLTGVKGGTDLLGALQFVSPASGCGIKFIVVSDGRPDDEFSTLTYAQQMKEKLNCIHIGSDPRGKEFMERLAAAAGGQSLESEVQLLSDNIVRLLNA
jgi:Mg-chelatase subunit ChlD